MNDASTWPFPDPGAGPDDDELRTVAYRARPDAVTAETERRAQHQEADVTRRAEADEARRRAAYAAHYDIVQALVEARLQTVAESTSRAARAAEFCRNASAAIVTLYTGLLGLAFSVDGGRPLPRTALAPATFLAAAVVLATAYVAFVSPGRETSPPPPHSSLPVDQERQIRAYSAWVNELTSRRSWALRSSVLCLGAGVLLLPVPYLSLAAGWVWAGVLVAAVLIVVTTVVTSGRGRGADR